MIWSLTFLISGGLSGTQRCSFFLFFFMHMYVWCVDMEVCMFLGVWACKYTCSQVCGYASTHVHRYMCIQVHMLTGVWVCKYTCSQCVGMQVHMSTGVWTCKYTCPQMGGHASTQVHRCVGMQVHNFTGVWASKYTFPCVLTCNFRKSQVNRFFLLSLLTSIF